MAIDTRSGVVGAARQVASPNQDARPVGMPIDAVIIHGISLPPGSFGGDAVERLFTNRLDPAAHPAFAAVAGLRVSSHLFIRREGELVQFVPLIARAWHAGRSCLGGRPRCNDYSIGIELEGTDDTPYTAAQYAVLRGVLGDVLAAYPGVARERIVGHAHVAPARKTDPGEGFDWQRLADL